MPLPILQPHGDPTREDLLRYYARGQLHWARHLGEEAQLDVGTAINNASLADVWGANQVRDVSLAEGMTPQQAMQEVSEHFAAAGTRCRAWTMNPAAPAARTRLMADHLLAQGYQRASHEIHYLQNFPTDPLREVAGLKIIPARASYRHVRALAEESAEHGNAASIAEASVLHLDDPHVDALVALRDGVAAAYLAVLSIGEIGLIEDLFVSEPARGQGIGRTMMSRALEICARSLFKHVFIGVASDNAPGLALGARCGFQKIGQTDSYRAVG
jgi:GNAT superfamily N-acetyltransferase